jgi:hypothetical protein
MNLNQSFYYVFYFMLFAFAVSTFAFTQVDSTYKPLLFLEMCITGISSFMYYLFTQHLKTPHAISLLRYRGWVITTPLMLIALHVLLHSTVPLVYLLGLDWLMLLFGYLGELRLLSRITAMVAGFIPFFLLFYALYSTATFTSFTYGIFWVYFLVWTGYGLSYLLNEVTKNAVTNVLDFIAKAMVALAISGYFISSKV